MGFLHRSAKKTSLYISYHPLWKLTWWQAVKSQFLIGDTSSNGWLFHCHLRWLLVLSPGNLGLPPWGWTLLKGQPSSNTNVCLKPGPEIHPRYMDVYTLENVSPASNMASFWVSILKFRGGIHIHIHIYTYTHIHIYTYTNVHIHKCTYVHYICTYVHMYICTHVHMYMYMYNIM